MDDVVTKINFQPTLYIYDVISTSFHLQLLQSKFSTPQTKQTNRYRFPIPPHIQPPRPEIIQNSSIQSNLAPLEPRQDAKSLASTYSLASSSLPVYPSVECDPGAREEERNAPAPAARKWEGRERESLPGACASSLSPFSAFPFVSPFSRARACRRGKTCWMPGIVPGGGDRRGGRALKVMQCRKERESMC